MYAYNDAMASKTDPARRKAPSMRYEGAAALEFVPLPLGGFAPLVDSGGVDTAGGVVVDVGEGDEAVGVVGVADDGEGDEALGVGGVADDGDGVGEGDGAVTLLFVVLAAPTVTVSFMPPEQ
jgi:hypothetical protein